MGLFDFFGGSKKAVELDKTRSDANKKLMREIFDKNIENGSEYNIVYAYSEDISAMNFAVIRTVSYKYKNFILGYRNIDMSLVFLEVSPDLTEVGEKLIYKPEDVKKSHYIKIMGSYYLQYGSTFKKEYFNFFVEKNLSDILSQEWYEEGRFLYIDQEEEHPGWVDFWNKFSK